jgi:hypothetical protein
VPLYLPGGVLAAGLLLIVQLEVLGALEDDLTDGLATRALKLEHDLLGRLGLLVEDRLSLTTVTRLLTVVTSLTASVQTSLAGLVLHHLERLVRIAARVVAVHHLLLRVVHHCQTALNILHLFAFFFSNAQFTVNVEE